MNPSWPAWADSGACDDRGWRKGVSTRKIRTWHAADGFNAESGRAFYGLRVSVAGGESGGKFEDSRGWQGPKILRNPVDY